MPTGLALLALLVSAVAAYYTRQQALAASGARDDARRSADAAEEASRTAEASLRLERDKAQDEADERARVARREREPIWELANRPRSGGSELVAQIQSTDALPVTVTGAVARLPTGHEVRGAYRIEPPSGRDGGEESRVVVPSGGTLRIRWTLVEPLTWVDVLDSRSGFVTLTVETATDDEVWKGWQRFRLHPGAIGPETQSWSVEQLKGVADDVRT